MEIEQHDVVIIGGGAAGLSAGLVLARARRRVAVVDAGRPRNAPAAHLQGYLSRDGMSPRGLLAVGRDEVASYGGELIDDTVLAVARGADGRFLVRLEHGGPLGARSVLVTTGLRDELPDVPGVAERWGRDLLHCPYCHGYEVKDRPLGVLGGTPDSVQHALLVRQWSADVAYFPDASELTAPEQEQLTARGIDVVPGKVARLVVADDQLAGVEMSDGRFIPRAAVFVRPVFAPAATLLRDLGVPFDAHGWPVVEAGGRAAVPGVWAAGNAVNPRAQVITAAGEGSAAAIAINNDLTDEDVRSAVDALHAGRSA